jgi:hypothetical protein
MNSSQKSCFEQPKNKTWYLKKQKRIGYGSESEIYEVYKFSDLKVYKNIEDAPSYAMKIYKEIHISPKDIEKYKKCSSSTNHEGVCVKVEDWWNCDSGNASSVIIFPKLKIDLWGALEKLYKFKNYGKIFCCICKALLVLKDLHTKYGIIHNDCHLSNFMFDGNEGDGRCYIIDLDKSTYVPNNSKVYLDEIENDYDIFFNNLREFGETYNFDYARDIAHELNSGLYLFFQELQRKYTMEELKQQEDAYILKITKNVFIPKSLELFRESSSKSTLKTPKQRVGHVKKSLDLNVIHKYHNPPISREFTPMWDNKKKTKEEHLINKLHFIWIGSPLLENNSKNVPKWVEKNQGCKYNIYIWYDSHFFDSVDPIESMLEYIVELNKLSSDKSVYLCDIRQYPIMTANFTKSFSDMMNVYEYEVGLQVRPGLSEYTREIRNWGIGSDILRLVILYLYGGFYVDIDMYPVRLCKLKNRTETITDESGILYYIKTCKNAICMAYSGKNINNNALYYHPEGRIKEKQPEIPLKERYYEFEESKDEEFQKNEEIIGIIFENGWKKYQKIMENYYYFLLYSYFQDTVLLMGPGALHMYFRDKLNDEFREDENVSTNSWNFGSSLDIVRAKLLIELINNDELVISTNKLLQYEDDYSSRENLIEIFLIKLYRPNYERYICREKGYDKPMTCITASIVSDLYKPKPHIFNDILFWEQLLPLIRETNEEEFKFKDSHRNKLGYFGDEIKSNKIKLDSERQKKIVLPFKEKLAKLAH